MSYEYYKIHKQGQHFQTYMKSSDLYKYQNQSINRSKLYSLLALHYNKLELCCYCRFILIFMIKDTSPNPGTRNRKPVLVIPCSPTPTFWYIEIWHHLRWWWWREWPVVKNYLYIPLLGNRWCHISIYQKVGVWEQGMTSTGFRFRVPGFGLLSFTINIWINLQ